MAAGIRATRRPVLGRRGGFGRAKVDRARDAETRRSRQCDPNRFDGPLGDPGQGQDRGQQRTGGVTARGNHTLAVAPVGTVHAINLDAAIRTRARGRVAGNVPGTGRYRPREHGRRPHEQERNQQRSHDPHGPGQGHGGKYNAARAPAPIGERRILSHLDANPAASPVPGRAERPGGAQPRKWRARRAAASCSSASGLAKQKRAKWSGAAPPA